MNPRLKHLLAACILILGLHSAAEAGPIRLAFKNMTVVGGTTFLVPVYVDSSLTGLNVISYQLDIQFNSTYLEFDSLITTGLMTASWASVANVSLPGRLLVAGSGATALSDTGRLVYLRFKAKIPGSNVGTGISFVAGTTLLNEGGITLSFANATITINVPPFITVSPNAALLTRGDTQQFNVSGATGPVTWSTTDAGKATINASGLLSATNPGFVRVVCADSIGIIDTTGLIEIRGMKLSVRDTSVYQGQFLNLPIQTTDVTGLGITSGQLTVTFNQNLWTATDVIVAGTILASASPEFASGPGHVSVSFAGISAISGSGTLVIVRLKATGSTYGASTIGFQNLVFNENLPANVVTGYATVQQLATINVSPGGTQQLVKGDSLQFNASGGTAPYTWAVSDSSRAKISATGVLKVLRGGSVVVTARDINGSSGSSGTINLYDFRLTVPSFSQLVLTAADTAVEFPLIVTANDTGFLAFQFKLNYGTGYYLKLDTVITSGTLSSGWSVAPGYSNGAVQIAAATTNAVTSAGTLIKFRFSVPDSTPRPSTTYINLTNVLFNEGAPIPLIENGYLQIRSTNAKPLLSHKTPSSLTSINVGTTQPFLVSSYDPDGDALTYTWKVNGTVEQNGGSASFSYLFSNSALGTTVTVVFQDPWGLKDSASWTFKVNSAPAPPSTVSPHGVSVPSPVQFVWTKSTDAESDPVSYALTVQGAKDTTVAGVVDTSQSVPLPKGTYSWFVSASDGLLLSVSDTASFTVPNTVPSSFAFTQPVIDTVEFNNVVIPIAWSQATDANSDTLTYIIRISGPGLDTLIMTLADTASITSEKFQPSSDYLITGKVTDGADTVDASNSRSVRTADALVGVGSEEAGLPQDYALSQNYPNPFNPSTTIQFVLPERSLVTLVIYDVLGNTIETLVSETMSPGVHFVRWNAGRFANGTYFYRLQAGEFSQTRKLVLLK